MLYQKYLQERIVTLHFILKFIKENNPCHQYPGFVTASSNFEKRFLKIKSINISGFTSSAPTKKKYRQNLAKEATLLGNLIFAYAKANKNVALKNAIHYTYSDFYRPIENTMLGRCRQVLSAARKIKDGEAFAINTQNIQYLESALKTYKEFMHNPQIEILQHARAYKQVNKLITECLNIAHTQLAPFIEMEYKDDSSMLTSFKSACKISKTSGRKRKYIRKPKPLNTVNPLSIALVAPHYVKFTKTTKAQKLQLEQA